MPRTVLLFVLLGLAFSAPATADETFTAGIDEIAAKAQADRSALSAERQWAVAGGAPGMDQEGRIDPTAANIAQLQEAQYQKCAAMRRHKLAMTQAEIHQADANTAPGLRGDVARQRLEASQAAASAAYQTVRKEQGRLTRMADIYISARQLAWYRTVDEAERILLEEQILQAQAMISGGCE